MYISIKSRLIFLLMVFTLLPFLLLRIVAYPKVQADLQEVLIQNLEGIGHKQAVLVTHWMHERIKNVSVIADNPFMIKCAKLTKECTDYSAIVQYLEAVKNKFRKHVYSCA